jgi:hypothetical protein
MKDNLVDVNIEELLTLLEVPVIKQDIAAKIAQATYFYKDEISDYFKKNSLNVSPFPLKNTIDYSFRLIRNTSGSSDEKNWELYVENNDKHLPVESILPRPVIDHIMNQKVAPDLTHIKREFKYNGSVYNLYFVKATENLVTGIVQKIIRKTADKKIPVIDIAQYTDLPESHQLEILKFYLDNHPDLRKEALFYFFTRILPFSKVLDEIT